MNLYLNVLLLFCIGTSVSSKITSAPDTEVIFPIPCEQNATTYEALSEYRLLQIFERGKYLLKQLPSLYIRLGGRILQQIPSPTEILNVGKQFIIGFPQEIIAYAINAVCSSTITMNALKPDVSPNINEMRFILMTPDNRQLSVPLSRADLLWNHTGFRRDWKVVFMVTGWNSNINETNDALDTMYKAFQCRDDFNFIAIDTSNFIDSLYAWSAFNTQTVGRLIGQSLVNLTKFVNKNNIHLIGHSLGAHICGIAGRTYKLLTSEMLPRITGLDPARPCFNEGEKLHALQRGDALFIDVIHSNSGILGVKESIGDVDFYPNGQDPLQPGCWSIVCAHGRSYEYFAETVYPGKELNFMATRCNSLQAYRHNRCGGKPIPMGIATPSNVRGNYYLETNSKSPFGKSLNRKYSVNMQRSTKCKH